MINLPLPARPFLAIPDGFRSRRVRSGRCKVSVELPAAIRSPLVVNYGMGTDSTALLVLLARMVAAGDESARPDLIMFADTGSEKIGTYEYLPVINEWLASVGFPLVTVVAKSGRGLTDKSLHRSCLRLRTMPSPAYGGKSCSLKWKADEMDQYLGKWMPAMLARAACLPVVSLIGYDASPADLRRSTIADKSKGGVVVQHFAYPLRDAGLTRPDLISIIESAGLPQPGKSACFMCPAMKREEVVRLLRTEPAKLAIALRIEAVAMLRTACDVRDGKLDSKGQPIKQTTSGLGRAWSWREYLSEVVPVGLARVTAAHDTGLDDWNAYQEMKRAPAALSA